MRLVIATAVFCLVLTAWGSAQVLTTRPPAPAAPPAEAAPASVPQVSIPLTVPAGTPLKLALDKEVRVRKVGQLIHAKLTEPVYAFDKVVVPQGAEVDGKVTSIAAVSKKIRTLAAMNADFSPYRQVRLEFDRLRLPDGRSIPIQTDVSPDSQAVLEFVAAKEPKGGKVQSGKNVASRKLREARQQAKQEWKAVRQQVHEPGKAHRLERYAMARLPYHPQYLEASTSFNADLRQPLDFGTEAVSAQALANIGTPPPSGSVVHAQLATPLNSATAQKDDPVEAVITQPLVASGHLVLPEGSRLQGSVLQARPARRLGRNGQLRIVFHRVVPPSGVAQQVQASLEAVAVAQGEHLALDSEGGAQVTTPRTRYLTTGVEAMLAASSATDSDAGKIGRHPGGNDVGPGAANGAVGFGLLGTVLGAVAHSRVVSSGFGFYGAGMSFYSHFLARGRDVVYPKDMSMVVGLGARDPAPAAPSAPPTAR